MAFLALYYDMSSFLPFPFRVLILRPSNVVLPVPILPLIQIFQRLISVNIPFILYIFHPLLREVESVCGSHSCA
jgi:hypothetical protein